MLPSLKLSKKGVPSTFTSLLIGTTGYCLLSSSNPGASWEGFFNIDIKIPSDVQPSYNMDFCFSIEYTYTGATPTVTWYANNGTEGSPNWVTLTPGIKGTAPQTGDTRMRPCSTGYGYDGEQSYIYKIPEVGSEFIPEKWLVDV